MRCAGRSASPRVRSAAASALLICRTAGLSRGPNGMRLRSLFALRRSTISPMTRLPPALLPLAAHPLAAAGAPKDDRAGPRAQLLGAMRDELARSMSRLRLADYEAPYFIAYAVREDDREEVLGKLGAVYSDQHRRDRRAWVNVRVGGYQFD